MVERRWRLVKYEEVYLGDYQSVGELKAVLDCRLALSLDFSETLFFRYIKTKKGLIVAGFYREGRTATVTPVSKPSAG